MTKSIRFYTQSNTLTGKEPMEIFTMEELIGASRPDLAEKPRMLSLGINVGEQEVFQQDILSLKIEDVKEDSNFWRQAIGKVMKEKEFDECVIHFYETKLLVPSYVIHLKRNGVFASHNTVTGRRLFSEGVLYEPKFTNLELPYLLISSGAKIVGNSFEHKELLPSDNMDACEEYC